MEQNRRELEKTTKLISNQESIAPTSTSTVMATPVAMPRVVNVDGIMNDPEEKCDDK